MNLIQRYLPVTMLGQVRDTIWHLILVDTKYCSRKYYYRNNSKAVVGRTKLKGWCGNHFFILYRIDDMITRKNNARNIIIKFLQITHNLSNYGIRIYWVPNNHVNSKASENMHQGLSTRLAARYSKEKISSVPHKSFYVVKEHD